jgi:oligo-1,6-glucosidase
LEQEKREDSLLNYYKKLIALRKTDEYKELLIYGKFEPLFEEEEKIFAYKRLDESGEILVLANFGKTDKKLELEKNEYQVLLNNMSHFDFSEGKICLKSCQAVVIK